jgi:hypothetical protein
MAGSPARFGTTKEAIFVGEERGGTIDGSAEVLIRDKATGTVEVVPISGGAAEGAVLPQQGNSLISYPQQQPQQQATLNPLNYTVLPEQFAGLRASMDGNLGIANTYSSQPAQFGRGLGQINAPDLYRGYIEAGVPELEARRVANLIGTLPNPRNAAVAFSRLNPADKMNVISAYRLAGIDEETFMALVNSAMVVGPERRALAVA